MGTERRLWVVYAVMAAMVIGVGAAAIQSVRATTSAAEELVTTHFTDMLEIERLRAATERESRCVRAYLLSPSDETRRHIDEANEVVAAHLVRLAQPHPDREHDTLVSKLKQVELEHDRLLQTIITEHAPVAEVKPENHKTEAKLTTARVALDEALDRLEEHESAVLTRSRDAGQAAGNRALIMLVAIALGSMLFAGGLGVFLARALRTLAEQRQLLERRNRELDAFAGQVAHDLRNVLSPMPIATSLIRNEAGENERISKNVERLDRASRRATRMLDGMLAFARNVGAPDPSIEASVPAVVTEVVEDLADIARKVDATIESDVGDLHVNCAPAVLHVILSNAVSNALKALEGQPQRTVRIAATSDGQWCELTVTDSGPGVPAEHLQRVFEPFFRVPGTRSKGTGIGLTTVYRVVEAHRGTVSLEPAPGGGTVFRVRLPLIHGEATATPP